MSLALDRWDFAVHADAGAEVLTYWTAHAFAYRPLNGICLAFLLVVLKRIVLRQAHLPTAPGHWYLLSMAVLLVIVRTEDLSRLAAPAESEKWFGGYSVYSMWMSFAYGMAIAAAFLGVIWMRQNLWWRITLLSMTFDWSRLILRYWDFPPITNPCEIRVDLLAISLHSVPAAVSVMAMIRDRHLGRRHDFYHRLGIFTLWAITLLSWPSSFWYASIYD
ncbi:MAG TPA: hypothetical protein VMP01_00090 [Pirellulaceae bacterium]|nr:hypothetical protein [Pirellulaceae bacterium]